MSEKITRLSDRGDLLLCMGATVFCHVFFLDGILRTDLMSLVASFFLGSMCHIYLVGSIKRYLVASHSQAQRVLVTVFAGLLLGDGFLFMTLIAIDSVI